LLWCFIVWVTNFIREFWKILEFFLKKNRDMLNTKHFKNSIVYYFFFIFLAFLAFYFLFLQVWAIDDQSAEQHRIQSEVSSWVLRDSFPEPGRASGWHSRKDGADVLWARRLVYTLLGWWLFPSIWWTQWGRINCVCLVPCVWFTVYCVLSVSVCFCLSFSWFALVKICLVWY